MTKNEKRSKAGSAGASARWARLTPEERKEQMSKLASRPRLTAEDFAWLRDNREMVDWLRDNRDALAGMVDSWKLFHDHGNELRLPESDIFPSDEYLRLRKLLGPEIIDAPDLVARYHPDGDEDDIGTRPVIAATRTDAEVALLLKDWPKSIGIGVDPAAPGGDRTAYQCSICLSEITDLDSPCPTCVKAGRLSANIGTGPGADVAALEAARHKMPPPLPSSDAIDRAYDLSKPAEVSPLDIPGATPPIETVTSVAAPSLSNALHRAPVPPPPPPPRAYTAQETCRGCGRLAELHSDHGGPIGHQFEPQV